MKLSSSLTTYEIITTTLRRNSLLCTCLSLLKFDRLEWTSELLEGYHAYLHANSPEDCQVTLDNVRKAYDMFMPVAMVTLLFKVVAMKDKEDIEPIIDRAKGLIQNVYTMTKLLEK
ncbi:unnamed protein product [Haemonchus placei]|uniref:Terpene_synth_C domain-containing protein n=1 Tax=Haemonchus placei TaxID=6290 RepID=A0A0N4X4G1_HAEPC|nr:unnamed protein product [Haemonchus placei]